MEKNPKNCDGNTIDFEIIREALETLRDETEWVGLANMALDALGRVTEKGAQP